MTDAQRTESLSDFLGEFIGTSILVIFGCGAVAVTVLFSAHSGLLQVAAIWGAAVTLAIYSTRHISYYVLGPTVGGTLAALTFKRVIEPIMRKKSDSNGCGCGEQPADVKGQGVL